MARVPAPGPSRIFRAAAVLAVAALLAHGVVPAPLSAQAVSPPGGSFRVEGEGRSFRHADHQRVTCGDCHRPDERHRSARTWTARDCAACHHGDEAARGCTSCHVRSDFAAPRRTATPMALSVWTEARSRDLLFEHDRHAAVGCLDCHRAGMNRPPESCAACHTDHHRPEAECARCHVAPDPAVHNLAAHASCAGAGCHSAAATARPMLSRQFCLVCHDTQREHRPNRVCVNCHIKPAALSRAPEPTDHGDL
jgi:hypothetical protein